MSDYIGIRGVSTTAPLSGYYIDDLEGLNLKLGAGLVNIATLSGSSFLQDKIRLGCKLVDDDVFTYILSLFRINDIIGTGIVGRLPNTLTPITYNGLGANDKGIRIKRVRSRLSKILIKSLDIYSNTTITGAVINIHDGNDTYPYAIDLVAGSHTPIDIYKEFENEYIYVTLDSTLVDTAKLPILRTYYDSTCDECQPNFVGYSNRNFTVSGWNGTTFENNTFGIVANIQVICSRSEFIKTIDHLLGRVKLLKTGICILNELIVSDRLNEYTLLGGEQAVLTITNWQTEYNTKMMAIRENLPTHYNHVDNICITCNSNRYINRI